MSKKKKSKKVDMIVEKKSFWTKKRAIAAGIIGAGVLALIIFAVVIFVLDLGPVRPIKSSEEEDRAVGTVAGYEVKYEELRYITLLYRAELEAEMGDYAALSDAERLDFEKRLGERVRDEIKNNYAILSLCEKYGIKTNSSELRSYVNNSIEELVEEIGSKDKYREWLSKNNLTDAFLRLMYKVEYLETALLSELVKRGEEIKYSETNLDDFVDFIVEDDSYVKTTHVFYPKEHEYIDVSNIRARALSELAAINSASDDEGRKTLIDMYIGKAPMVQGYSETGKGYYFTYGQMPEQYEKAAFALKEYGVSELVELEEGYYIIMRVPKETSEAASRARELLTQYRYAVLKQLCDKQKSDIRFDGNEYFKSLKLLDIK